MWRSRVGQRGSSLVEVLAVMVVLLVGILTIIRLFPIGFTNLRHTEYRTIASRLAAGQVEWWKNNSSRLPDAVGSVDPTVVPLGSRLNPDVIPDDLGPLSLTGSVRLPAELTKQALWSDVNKTRRIVGETTSIPAPTTQESGGTGSLYFVSLAPMEWPTEAYRDPDKYLLIYGADLVRTDVTGLDAQALQSVTTNLKSRDYAVDYKAGVLIFNGTNFDRTYRVSYSFPTLQGLRAVTAEIVRVPRRPAGTVYAVPLAQASHDPSRPGPYAIEPLSERVARKFRYVSSPGAFSPDEYEFTTLVPSGSAWGAAVQQITGGLLFNPVGFRAYERGPSGLRPLTARIDYTVADWHVLHEDRVLGDRAPYSVKLALPFIKQAGITNEYDGTVYKGLTDAFATASRGTSATPGPSVIAVNLATGALCADGGDAFPSLQNGNLDVDYKQGLVRFARVNGAAEADARFHAPNAISGVGKVVRMPGLGVRIFYRADGDWAVALQKANSNYELFNGVPSGLLPSGRYWVSAVMPDVTTKTGRVHVTFPPSDAGKTVVLNFTYTAADGTRKTVYGVQGQITDRSQAWENTGGVQHPYITVQLPPDADVSRAQVVLSQVRGVSVRSVAIWREGPSWKRQEVSTYLARSEIQ